MPDALAVVAADDSSLGWLGPSRASQSLALRADGPVWGWGWGWGNNDNVQAIGTGTYRVLTPQQLEGLPSIAALAAGGAHSLALAADGAVWDWGANTYGQLGNGTEAGPMGVGHPT